MQPNCYSLTGKPCSCQRINISCFSCGEKFSVTTGENASPPAH